MSEQSQIFAFETFPAIIQFESVLWFEFVPPGNCHMRLSEEIQAIKWHQKNLLFILIF
jgi:hypothetical protein